MRDRHIHIPQDSTLLKLIYREVEKHLIIDRKKFTVKLCTKFIFYACCCVMSYSSLYFVESPYLFILCFVGFGFSILLFAFNFAHDFSHGTVFKNSKWNDFSFIFIYMINGAHGEAWKKRHVESHHYAPNVEHYDSDLEISSLIRVIPNSARYWFHRFQHLYAPLAYMSYSIYWVFIKDFVIFFSERHTRSTSYQLSFWFQKIFYVAYLVVLPIIYTHQSWYVVLIGFTAMHLLQSLFLLFTFFMTHHVESVEYPIANAEGFIATSWIMNQIKSSNDMHPFSKLANFILGGFNNHIAHHLFPHIHHVHYPQLSRILYKTLIESGVTPNQTTYLGGIRSHLRHLRNMGRN